MGFDNSTLLRQTSQEIIDGLRKERGAFADMVCTSLDRRSIKGSEPYRASKDSLGRDHGRQAIGADPIEVNFSLSSLDWNMGRYSHMFALDVSEITDLGQYVDPLTAYLETIKDSVEIAIDNDLAALLVNASVNNSQAASNGAWSSASSTPVQDMQAARKDKAPDADMCILGLATAYELARHPEMKEAVSQYTGGGAISFAAMRSGVAEVLNMPAGNVYIFGSFYDSANDGQALSLAYTAGDLCWIGSKRGLIKIEQPTSENVETLYKHQTVEVSYCRTLDLQRVDKNLGAYVTGL